MSFTNKAWCAGCCVPTVAEGVRGIYKYISICWRNISMCNWLDLETVVRLWMSSKLFSYKVLRLWCCWQVFGSSSVENCVIGCTWKPCLDFVSIWNWETDQAKLRRPIESLLRQVLGEWNVMWVWCDRTFLFRYFEIWLLRYAHVYS